MADGQARKRRKKQRKSPTGWRVREKPNGKWLGLASVPGEGRYESKVWESKSEANDWAKQRHAEMVAGVRVAKQEERRVGCDTAALARCYVDSLKGANRSPSHVRECKRVLDGLAAAVPDLAVKGVSKEIEAWLNAATAELAPATRNRWLVAIRGMCRFAVRHEDLERDPTAAITRSQMPEFMKQCFSIEEARRLLCWVDDPWHARFATMLYTGLRVQECAGLEWQDIDWQGRTVMVRLRLEKGQMRTTRVKRKRERLVPLSDELAAILLPLRRERGPLFPSMEYNPNRGFAGFLARAGVAKEGRSPHSCRHSYGGMMTAAGLVTPLLMAYMGHSNINTTLGYTKEAVRYAAQVAEEGWKMGQMRLLTGLGMRLEGAELRKRRQGAKHSRVFEEVVGSLFVASGG